MYFFRVGCVLLLLVLLGTGASAQRILVNPIAGHFTDTTALFWLATKPSKKASLDSAFLQNLIDSTHKHWLGTIESLAIDSILRYKNANFYHVSVRRRAPKADSFGRDMQFLTGSCAFQYPRFTFQRKKRNKIFETMRQKDAEYMIWLGDNVYYLAGQWNNPNKMVRKNLRVRRRAPIREFFTHLPHYALWDDHDYGPNNSDSRFPNKHLTTKMFKHTWRNAYWGLNDLDSTSGVGSHFSKSDVDFFFLDTRTFSNFSTGEMLGKAQMDWLIARLRESKANFKIVAIGAQVLTDDVMGVHMGKCVNERKELLDLIAQHKIEGVVFLSGDRHFSEVSQWKREGNYTLQEITISPLTSFIDERGSANSYRLPHTFITDTNFARFHVRGSQAERELFIECFDRKGNIYWTHTIKLSELRK